MNTIARRFIIICLVFLIFALLMAEVVANNDRRRKSWHSGAIGVCIFLPGLNCTASR